jgi:hypothetical protein
MFFAAVSIDEKATITAAIGENLETSEMGAEIIYVCTNAWNECLITSPAWRTPVFHYFNSL